jgi:hypothetical protein
MAGKVGGEPRVALRLRPDRAGPDARPGRAPADRPRRAARAGIGIGFELAVRTPPRAPFEAFD